MTTPEDMGVPSAPGPSAAETLVRETTRLLNAVPGPIRRVRMRVADCSLEVEWHREAHAPDPPADHVASGAEAVPKDDASDGPVCIRSPMVGTFYRAPAPGAAPFVNVGDEIHQGQQVAVIEAMKLLNEVHADRQCRIAEILVADGTPVEFDQPLFAVTSAGP